MLTKSQIQFIQSLRQKKRRDQEGCFVAEGSKLVLDLLQGHFSTRHLYALSSWAEEFREETRDVEVTVVSDREMQRVSGLATRSSVLAVMDKLSRVLEQPFLNGDLTLVLDDIRDPGNLGTMIRVADWFGLSLVICSPETVDLYNPKVIQGTMGSIARVQVVYRDLARFFAETAGQFPVYGLTTGGTDLFAEPLEARGCLLVGNEARGFSPAVQPFITQCIAIPFYPKNRSTPHAESLNAAVAAGIACAAFRGIANAGSSSLKNHHPV